MKNIFLKLRNIIINTKSNIFIKKFAPIFVVFLFFSLFSFLPLKAFADDIAFSWVKGINGSGSIGREYITTDSTGNIYITGTFQGIIDFDPGVDIYNLTSSGSNDAFISKFDSSGNLIWAKAIGGIDYDVANSMSIDSVGNLVVAGYFAGTVDFDPGVGVYELISVGSYDAFFAKFDSSGNLIWAKAIGGAGSDVVNSIVIDSVGNLGIAGNFAGTVDFDPGSSVYNLTSVASDDAFFAKFDSSGNLIWAKAIGGTGNDKASSIAAEVITGNFYITGFFQSTVDFDPGSSVYNLTSVASDDAFFAKFDSLGNFIWAKRIGGVNNDVASFIAIDSVGNLGIAGNFAGTVDFDPGVGVYNLSGYNSYTNPFLSKFDSSGNLIWAKVFYTTNHASVYSLVSDVNNNFYVSGSYQGSMDANPNSGTKNLSGTSPSKNYIIKLDSLGNYIWSNTYNISGCYMTLDSNGNVFVTGPFSGTIDFDPSAGVYNLTSVGSTSNTYIVKFSPAASDFIPSIFTFTDQTLKAVNTSYESNTITLSGLNEVVAISISSCSSLVCEYSINNGTYTSVPGIIISGDTVKVRQKSSIYDSTTTDLVLNIGGVTDTFSLTTDDWTKPLISSFSVPVKSTSYIISITNFVATDDQVVAGYLITESSITPSVNSPDWTVTAPTTYTVFTNGTKTLYSWAKDNTDRVSNPLSAQTIVDTSPIVSSFIIPSNYNSATVPISTFNVSDNIGVTGYMVTENLTVPNINDSGWTETAPTSYTFGSINDTVPSTWNQRTAAAFLTHWPKITSSSDGNKIAAVIGNIGWSGGGGYVYTSNDAGNTWTARTGAGSRNWSGITSSSDGTKLVAVTGGDYTTGYVYTSTDSGVTWIARTGSGSLRWHDVTSSSDGTKLAAITGGRYYNGSIYTSTNSGVTWTAQAAAGSRYWMSIASSSDGTKLVAHPTYGYIYTSNNSGVTWTERTSSGTRSWIDVASSSDGVNLIATSGNGYIYTSRDGGATWIERTSSGIRNWGQVASSSDGVKLIAATSNSGYIYYSNDSGTTWVEQKSMGSKERGGVTFSADGTKIVVGDMNGGYIYTSKFGNELHGWVKDSEGQVSSSSIYSNATVLIDLNTPVITAFSIPTNSSSLTVPITTFTATDNVGVTGYILTESATPPLAGNAGWTENAPATYTFGSYGNKTLYAWVKDILGTISTPLSASVTLNTAPSITSFTVPTDYNSLTVPITTFTATDDAGVTGYKITENDSIPSALDSGWNASAPTTYTFSKLNDISPKNWVQKTSDANRSWQAIASSSDGTKIVAVVSSDSNSGYIYTSNNSGTTWTERTNAGLRKWKTVAISSDGTKLVAGVYDGYVYISEDSGITWIERQPEVGRRFNFSRPIVSSSDGTKLAFVENVCVNMGRLYTSTDSGETWTYKIISGSRVISYSSDGGLLISADNYGGSGCSTGTNGGYISTSTDNGSTWIQRTNAGLRKWSAVASSSDGTKLFATADDETNSPGYIYTSIDGGLTWLERVSAGSHDWKSINSSSDGLKLTAQVKGQNYSGDVYTSTDSGTTWNLRNSNNSWYGVTLSSDGNKIAAVVNGGYVYTSTVITTAEGSKTLYAWAKDANGGVSNPSSNPIVVNANPPTSIINPLCDIPENRCTTSGIVSSPQQVYSVQLISGISYEAVSDIEISIEDDTSGKWFSNGVFSSDTEIYSTITNTTAWPYGTKSWSYDLSTLPLTIGHTYKLNVKATDTFAEAENPVSTMSFVFSSLTLDDIAPVITLAGLNPTNVTLGQSYSEPGADALDAISGTRPVSISGTVNNNALGAYTITYTATDMTGNIGTATRIVNIIPSPTVSFNTISGNGEESVSPISIVVELSRVDDQNTTVNYALSGTALNADYTLANGTITFLAGETSKEISIPVIDDILNELDETIILTLSNPVNGIIGGNASYTYTINDNDIASGIEFLTSESSNSESLTTVDIPISLASASGTNTTIDYTLSGTATNGDDYILDDGTVTIVAGETTTNINISIINDILKEENETVIIALSNPTNSTLGANSTYTYTITDDDILPSIGFDVVSSEGDENITTVNIPVSISSPYAEDVTFSYSATDGTATGGDADYSLISGTGTIIAGETSTNIMIVVFDDDISEETETLLVSISNPGNATLGNNIGHIYSILDNEISITSVTGNNIKSTSARIVWTTADFTDGLIEYGIIAPGNEGTYNLQKSNDDKTLEHSFYLGNLTPETTYYFRTTSINLNNETTVFESQFTTTPGPVISDVLSSEITDTAALITWNTDIPATSHVNYGKDLTLTTFERLGSDELVTTHSVLLTNLTSDSTYYYLVDGIDEESNETEDANDGDYYNFITGNDQTPPVLSEITVPILTSDQAAIVWSSNEPADGKIMFGTSTGVYENETDLISTPLTNHLATIGGLEKTTTYYYVVESSDPSGNTTTSEEQSFITLEPGEVIIYRGSGGGIMGVAQELYDLLLNENKIYKDRIGSIENEPVISNIQISNVTAFGATISFETDKDTIGFIDYDRNSNYSLLAADKNWSRSHLIVLHGLNFGTDYFFKITAMNKSNLRSVSDEQNFKTKFFSENIDELTKIENIEQFQKELESTIESILPSIVPPFIDVPVVSDITENSATISFRTNVSAYPIIGFTPESSYDASKENSYNGEISDTTKKGVSHVLNLVNLKPNTKYHFIVKAFSLPQVIGKSDDFTFMTQASKIQGSIVDIKKDSFTVVWNTDEPTTSIVEYKNINTGRVSRIVDNTINSYHSIKVENLTPGTQYEVTISGVSGKGNIIEGGSPLNIRTSTDNIIPVISSIKVDSALVVGREDKVQTIISWQTDEPSTSTVHYEEGSGSVDSPLSSKQEDSELTKNHVVILNSLKPGTVYRFSVESMDGADNVNKQPVRTIITPKKSESIIDVIFKNFDDTFNFIDNVR